MMNQITLTLSLTNAQLIGIAQAAEAANRTVAEHIAIAMSAMYAAPEPVKQEPIFIYPEWMNVLSIRARNVLMNANVTNQDDLVLKLRVHPQSWWTSQPNCSKSVVAELITHFIPCD